VSSGAGAFVDQRLRCGDVDTAISPVEGSARKFSAVVNTSAKMLAMKEIVLLVAKPPYINVNVERQVHFELVQSQTLGVRILVVNNYLA
jgi:hypothetical protein